MRVRLLGTGSADRLPNPWCACARCTAARATGEHRNRTSALVDDVLLVDPGPDAGSGGVDLHRVRTVLVTHAHPDHLDPAFLLAWAWAGAEPLVVAGPAEALDQCRPWVGPGAPVEFRELVAGDVLETATHRIRALSAAHSTTGGRDHDGTALLFEVTSDARLLYATDTAALPFPELSGPYDLVLLELSFGEATTHGTAHLDLPTFGHEVAGLRSGGQLAEGAQVVAVHLSHHTPADLLDRLAAVGARVVPDGTVLRAGVGAGDAGYAEPGHAGRPGRRLLVTGGARSGKSRRAESLAAGRANVTYVATAPAYPDDPAWQARIAAHRDRRPPEWEVRETADLPATLAAADPDGLVLVDCLTLWLSRLIDDAGTWDDAERAEAARLAGTAALTEALADCPADVILVTNEIGDGIVPHTASGRLFRDLLGALNVAVAAMCDDVELVTCGIPRTLKGAPWPTPS